MEATVGIVEAILAVCTAVGDWIVTAFTALSPLFYVAGTGLTFLGTLCVMGLAIGIIFLIIGVIQNFLRMRS